ncbi:MAG TPA: tRNA (adenosine(37)-N6)-dimethylallyltransferase MiaA [Firmicutes bacterium]|nr:tRNA (adenosine(37)-N6)-dimethylallyltransferase MiaA [Bacillota bacterium]
MEKTPLLVLVGPTASGKTAVALELADLIPLEIISADSMQIYRGMDIGTAKPGRAEREKVSHHLLDLRAPWQSFSVVEYQRLVTEIIPQVLARGCLPTLVGGTGLYIQAVVDEYRFAPQKPDPRVRAKWQNVFQEVGKEGLHRILEMYDPQAARQIHPHNVRRVIRALEVAPGSGNKIAQKGAGRYDLLMVGLELDRAYLYQRIDDRVDAMLANGWLGEVKRLRQLGVFAPAKPAMTAAQALGYRELNWYLQGWLTWPEAVRLIKRNTRRFAKRQLTWFRRDPRIKWLRVGENTSNRQLALEIAAMIANKWKIKYNGVSREEENG